MDREQFQKAYGKIVAKAWADEGFKNKLLADPKAVLKENGIEFPENTKLNILEGKEGEINLILPPTPSAPEQHSPSAEEWGVRIAAFACFGGLGAY